MMNANKFLRRVGLMGGTFDPIHNAHLALADCALKTLRLDQVWFLPAAVPYLNKETSTSFEDRLRMVELAITGCKCFQASDIEAERQGKTYTVDTLRILKNRYPETEFFFMIGSDQLYSLDSWQAPEEIFRLAVLAAAEREYPGAARCFTEQIQYLVKRYGGRIEALPFVEMNISSTDIRRRVSEGCDVTGMVPDAVRDYILEKSLYRSNT